MVGVDKTALLKENTIAVDGFNDISSFLVAAKEAVICRS